MKVAFFASCVADRFFAESAADAVRLLRHLGVEVDVPDGATCCGQPAFNAGYAADARRMARRLVDVLAGADHVVLASGSCAAMLHHHVPRLLEGAPDAERARDVARRSLELARFTLRVLGIEELGRGLAGLRVAYHYGCHALRDGAGADDPVRLLRGAGAEVVPWEDDRECCGFGGLFSVKLPAVSAAMADRKLDTLPAADVLTSADGGCLLQLGGRAKRRGEGPPVRHLASLLWEAVG